MERNHDRNPHDPTPLHARGGQTLLTTVSLHTNADWLHGWEHKCG